MYKGVAVVNFVNVISGHSIFLSELFRNEKVVNCVLLDETLRFSNKPCPVFKKKRKHRGSIPTHFCWLQSDTLLDSVSHRKKTKIYASEWGAIYLSNPILGLVNEFSKDHKKCFQWSVCIIRNYFCIATPPEWPNTGKGKISWSRLAKNDAEGGILSIYYLVMLDRV